MTTQRSEWPDLFALFERISDAPLAERSRLLDEVAAKHPDLRERLERLLLLDASGHDISSDVAEWRGRIGSDDSDAPTRIGPWRIIRELGAGGMGRVFLAERCDGEYEQHVALKLIRGELVSNASLARFVRERSILARLDHPGIATLVDGGVEDGGRPWFAMQLVDGQPLPEYCRELHLGIEARLRLLIAACDAVAYAHRQLVVHCDLKPSNVLVDRRGQPRLLDFGIARLLEADGTPGSSTQTQARAMTPGYAAPEQLTGKPISVASDVYALGAMLYELLTGQRPYSASEESPAAVAVAQLRSEARHMSRVAASSMPFPSRRLRGDLDLIAARALRYDPAQRYAGADAFADDLRRYLDGRPIAARRGGTAYRVRRFIARHRIAVSLAALAIAGLIGATAFAWMQMRDARGQAARAEVVRRFLVGVFDQASPDENKGQPITARQLLEKGEGRLDEALRRQPDLDADITALLGQLYIDVSDFDRAEVLLKRALA
ncbi:MAG: protein kinase domain-containing protein, partial [Rhodanobacteraceae bacterium]